MAAYTQLEQQYVCFGGTHTLETALYRSTDCATMQLKMSRVCRDAADLHTAPVRVAKHAARARADFDVSVSSCTED